MIVTGFRRHLSYSPILELKENLLVLMDHSCLSSKSNGDAHRNICLIPASAHGTNPASAVMAGMKVVVTGTAANGKH